jgi:hypothetical protein
MIPAKIDFAIFKGDSKVRKKIGLAVLLATLSGIASAHDDSCKIEHLLWFTFDVCSPDGGKGTHVAAAPEMDPATAMAGLTLVLGGLAVMGGRRRYSQSKV